MSEKAQKSSKRHDLAVSAPPKGKSLVGQAAQAVADVTGCPGAQALAHGIDRAARMISETAREGGHRA